MYPTNTPYNTDNWIETELINKSEMKIDTELTANQCELFYYELVLVITKIGPVEPVQYKIIKSYLKKIKR